MSVVCCSVVYILYFYMAICWEDHSDYEDYRRVNLKHYLL